MIAATKKVIQCLRLTDFMIIIETDQNDAARWLKVKLFKPSLVTLKPDYCDVLVIVCLLVRKIARLLWLVNKSTIRQYYFNFVTK